MKRAFFTRTLSGLTPDDDVAREMLRGIAVGRVVAVEVYRPRNLEFLRLYWAMASKIADAIGVETDNVSDVLKVKTGHYTTVQTKSETLKFPRSISFAKMTEPEFKAFFERCCRIICTEWLPHMDHKQVQSELLEMMGIKWESAA